MERENRLGTPTLLVFTVSHDKALLDALPKANFISPISLQDLGLPAELAGNQLAENRFLLTNKLTSNTSDFVGFVSARWDERFPTWPNLDRLDSLLTEDFNHSNYYFSPQTIMASGPQVVSWIKAQDAVHPGMSKVLFEVLDELSVQNFADKSLRGISMGNNFIVSHQVAEELIEFWQKGFAYLYEKYGFDLPFNYRCASCGFVSAEGVGRWDRSRHAGFLFERLTALFFATNPELIPVEPHKGRNRKVRRSLLAFGFSSGPLLFKWYKTILRFGKHCDHAHEALGKKKK